MAYVPIEGAMQHAQEPLQYNVAVHRADLDIDRTTNSASLFVMREGQDTARFVSDIRVGRPMMAAFLGRMFLGFPTLRIISYREALVCHPHRQVVST